MNLCKVIYPYEECLWAPECRNTAARGVDCGNFGVNVHFGALANIILSGVW